MSERADVSPPPADAPLAGYRFLPFRFARVQGLADQVLLVSDAGEFLFLREAEFSQFLAKSLEPGADLYLDLQAKNFLVDASTPDPLRVMASKMRTKKCFLRGGPALHEFVVTLRCDHSCCYCQASRRLGGSGTFDMTPEIADVAVERMFDSPAPELTVEFQGGEPLLAFELIKHVTERALELRDRQHQGRTLGFTVVSTLHHLTDEMLEFFDRQGFHLCTSLDGPEWLHDANRPCTGGDSYRRTVEGIERARAVVGSGRVSAITTLTRRSLSHPDEIIETYARLGFETVSLRPVSPFGFAAAARAQVGYSAAEFVAFYEKALDRIISLNRNGTRMCESYSSLLLTHILTPFATRYVDLRSPCGAGIGVLVYNYDGGVYLCDEGRMLAEMGDSTFRLGSVEQPYLELLRSDALLIALSSSITEALPGCVDCAYQPYCGACPAHALACSGDPVGHRPTSDHCSRHRGMFEILFRRLHAAEPETMRLFLDWALRQPLGRPACLGQGGS